MLLERLSLFTAALALGQAPSSALALVARQPTPSALDYLDLEASGIAAEPGTAECAAVMSLGNVAFPNARIPKSGGYIECRQRLVFARLPSAMDFTFLAASVMGELNLDAGSYVDEIEVMVDYLPVSPFRASLRSLCIPLSPLSFFSPIHDLMNCHQLTFFSEATFLPTQTHDDRWSEQHHPLIRQKRSALPRRL